MTVRELLESNIQSNLSSEIQHLELGHCSNSELALLINWTNEIKEHADFLTLEDEVVGYTYNNLDVLVPKISEEEHKRGIQLIKIRKFNK